MSTYIRMGKVQTSNPGNLVCHGQGICIIQYRQVHIARVQLACPLVCAMEGGGEREYIERRHDDQALARKPLEPSQLTELEGCLLPTYIWSNSYIPPPNWNET